MGKVLSSLIGVVWGLRWLSVDLRQAAKIRYRQSGAAHFLCLTLLSVLPKGQNTKLHNIRLFNKVCPKLCGEGVAAAV